MGCGGGGGMRTEEIRWAKVSSLSRCLLQKRGLMVGRDHSARSAALFGVCEAINARHMNTEPTGNDFVATTFGDDVMSRRLFVFPVHE